MASKLLLEDGFYLELEDGSGDLLLEQDITKAWFVIAQQIHVPGAVTRQMHVPGSATDQTHIPGAATQQTRT